jgi:hydroxymethylglutaryl-CoA synthase
VAGIVGWGCYIPRNRIRVEEVANSSSADAEKIKSGLKVIEKSVPGIDEDTITISVEAARNAIKVAGIKPDTLDALYIGSESHPYAVKPTGTVLAEALGVGNKYTTADFEFACKAGTAAIQVGLAWIKSGMAKLVLVGGCDTAQASPGDPLEYTAAAGGAVFILGLDNVVAQINHTVSFTSDTPDFWRREHEKYPSHAGAFTGQPAYYKHIINATKMLLGEVGKSSDDYDYVVFHQPNGKFPERVAKVLGFTKKQYAPGLLVDRIGNTYSGASMLGLSAVLDVAKPGESILVTSYGSGAGSDSFDIVVTDEIEKVRSRARTVESYIQNKIYISYTDYLKNTGVLE